MADARTALLKAVPLFAHCTPTQLDCIDAPNGGDPEVDESKLTSITFYAHTLAVPARRNVDDPTVLKGRETVRVRLHGVDTPETAQPFGSVAKKRTSDLVFGKVVTVEVRDTDQYGRTVGWVTFTDAKRDTASLNETLVVDGLAWWYRYYAPRDRVLEQAESAARKAKRGLWSQPNPVAPWEWRKRDRAQAA